MVNIFQEQIRRISPRLRTIAIFVYSYGLLATRWILDRIPIVGYRAVRRRLQVVLEPYVRTGTLRGSLMMLASCVALPLFCLLYGFFYAIWTPFLLVPFVLPIGLVAVLIIWALPDLKRPPIFGLELLLPTFLIVTVLWPDYLAISLPGLPWITLRRLIGLPLGFLLLVCLSASKRFRKEVYAALSTIKPLFYFGAAFVVVQILTIPLSKSPVLSAQLVFSYQINWTCIFVLSCVIFRNINYVEKYFSLLVILASSIIMITLTESYRQRIPWSNHIPDFLKVGDEVVQRILTPNFRLYVNRYRANATFFTPLALAEFLSLTLPFIIHFAFSRINILLRICLWLMVPLLFLAIVATDSRLGLVGMLACLVLYGFLWSIVQWRARSRDLFAAAVVFSYPAISAIFLGLVLGSHRARQAIFGGEAQASSNASRDRQVEMMMDALARNPLGHGAGQSGPELGYAPGDFITVDNYFVLVAMDYGVIGAFLWYGFFLIAIFVAVRACLAKETAARPEARLLAPLAVALSTLLILKWVHGQDDNHSIYFLMVGMIVALIWRLRNLPSPSKGPA